MSGQGQYNRSSRSPDNLMSQFIRSQKKKEKLSPLELAILGGCSFTKAKEMKKSSEEENGSSFSEYDTMFGRKETPIKVVHKDFYNDFGDLFADI